MEFNKVKNLFFILVVIFTLSFAVCAQSATVVSEKANLRGTPSEQGKVVDTISRNATLEILKQRGAWFLVQTSDYVGWLHGNTIKLNESLTLDTVDDAPVPTAPRVTRKRQIAPVQSAPQAAEASGYIRGPRGGCYYINSRGNKTYVNRSLCN